MPHCPFDAHPPLALVFVVLSTDALLDQGVRKAIPIDVHVRQDAPGIFAPSGLAEGDTFGGTKALVHKVTGRQGVDLFGRTLATNLRGVNTVDADGHLFDLRQKAGRGNADRISIVSKMSAFSFSQRSFVAISRCEGREEKCGEKKYQMPHAARIGVRAVQIEAVSREGRVSVVN